MQVNHYTSRGMPDPFTVGNLMSVFPLPTDVVNAIDKRVFEEIHRITQLDAEKRLHLYPPVSPSRSHSLTLMDILRYVFTQPCTLALPFPC